MVSTNLAGVYAWQGKYQKSLDALQYFDTISYTPQPEIIISNLNTIAFSNYKLQRFKEAFFAMDSLHTLEMKRMSQNRAQTLMNLETKYQTEKKEKENLVLKQKNLQQTAKNRTLILLVALVVFVLIIVLLSVYFVLRARKLKSIQEKSELENKQLRLQNEKMQLEQKALRSQINTHFIFNALDVTQREISSGSGLQARNHLSEIIKLIRLNLENASDSVISLEDEIHCVRTYLKVCSMIYKNRFTYEIEIDEKIDLENCAIPPMLVQPHLENAIIHGVLPCETKGIIRLSIDSQHEILHCQITNSAPEIKKERAQHEYKRKSMGMEVTLQRLKANNEPHQVSSEIQAGFVEQGGEKMYQVDFQIYSEAFY